MLTEGSGPPSGADTDEERQRRRKSPAAPTGTRLQAYTAEPSDVPPTVTTTTVDSEGNEAPEPVNTISGYSMTAPVSTGYTLASGAGGTEAPVRKVIKVDQAEQEAKTYRARRTDQMNWDEYLGLSDRERAAVDFNTMLVKARQKDLNRGEEYKPTDAQREVYDQAVERMFGEQGVSETFAPETVALLTDIGFKQTDAKRFNDLDDFLGLSAALTAKDLGKLSEKPLELKIDEAAQSATGAVAGAIGAEAQANPGVATIGRNLAEGTQALTESLTRGNQVLENWRQIGAGALNESIGYFGGIPNKIASPDIRLNEENDEYFQAAFNALADSTNGPEVLEIIRKDLGTEERFKKFLRFADTKSAYSQDTQMNLGGDPRVPYRSPDEFRQLLGLGKYRKLKNREIIGDVTQVEGGETSGTG